jgi:hypothetical protein
MTARERRAAARGKIYSVHESGHVIARIYTNLPFETVFVKRSKTKDGRITLAGAVGHKYKKTPYEWDEDHFERRANMRKWLEDEAVIDLAGMVAERRYAPRGDWRYGAGSDMRSLNRVLDLLDIKGKVNRELPSANSKRAPRR